MKTIFLLIPITDHCSEWVDENVNVDLKVGKAIPIETRYLGPVVEGLIAADFNIGEDFKVV